MIRLGKLKLYKPRNSIHLQAQIQPCKLCKRVIIKYMNFKYCRPCKIEADKAGRYIAQKRYRARVGYKYDYKNPFESKLTYSPIKADFQEASKDYFEKVKAGVITE